MGYPNLDAYRAMMGKYNLGSIELIEGKDGESKLIKVDSHQSWLLGRILNADKEGEGSHAGGNFAARQNLLKAFRDDIAAKYGEGGAEGADKLSFLKTAELILLGGDNATKALKRDDVVAKLLNAYDEIRLSWKPLSARSISAMADEKSQKLTGIGKDVSEWTDALMKNYAAGNKCCNDDDLSTIAFLADISATEVETLFRTRGGAISAFVKADVRLSNLNEMEKDLNAGKLDKRQIGLVALQRAIYYVKTGDIPDDLKKAQGLDVKPQEPEEGQKKPSDNQPNKIAEIKQEIKNGDVRQEPPKEEVQQPKEQPKEEQEVKAGDQVEVKVEAQKKDDPILTPLQEIEKLEQAHQNFEQKIKAELQKALDVAASNSCEPYASQILDGCQQELKDPITKTAKTIAKVIAEAREQNAAALSALAEAKEKLKNLPPEQKEAAEATVVAAKGKCELVQKSIEKLVGTQAKPGEMHRLYVDKAQEIHEEFSRSEDPKCRLLHEKNNFYLRFWQGDTKSSLEKLGTKTFGISRNDNLVEGGGYGVNPDFADDCLRCLLGWPADSKDPLPDNLQKPEIFKTLSALVKASIKLPSIFNKRKNADEKCPKDKEFNTLFTGRDTCFKGLVDVLASGEFDGVSQNRLIFFLTACAVSDIADFNLGGNNPVELMKVLRNGGMSLNTVPIITKGAAGDPFNQIVLVDKLRLMNGGSMDRLDSFCKKVFGNKEISELSAEEVTDKYDALGKVKTVNLLKGLSKVEQDSFQFVNGGQNFSERLGKGGDAAVKEDLTVLLDAVRTLNDGKAGDSAEVAFRKCKFTLTRGKKGELSVTIGKDRQVILGDLSVGELLAALENDLFSHAKDFGLAIVSKQLPEQTDESPAAREKFLRVAVAFTGMNALELSRVPTGELAQFAVDLANGQNPDPGVRFANYLNSAYQLDNQAELEELLRPEPENGQPAGKAPVNEPARNELKSISTDNVYDVSSTNVINSWKNASDEDKKSIVFNQPPKTDLQKAHDFIADLVFNKEAWTYDSFRNKSGKERIQDVFSRHMDTVVLLMKKPYLLSDSIDGEKFGLKEDVKFPFNGEEISIPALKVKLIEMFTGLKSLVGKQLQALGLFDLNKKIASGKPLTEDESKDLSQAFKTLVDMASKGEDAIVKHVDKLYGIEDLQREADELQEKYDKAVAAEASKPKEKEDEGGLFGFLGLGNITDAFAKGTQESTRLGIDLKAKKSQIERDKVFAEGAKAILPLLGDLDGMIGQVANAMTDFVQKKITDGIEQMLETFDTGKADAPAWQQSLDDLQKAGVIDPKSGYGLFLKNSAKIYFAGMTADDRRQLLAAGIRYSAGAKNVGDVANAFVKGLGPLMQKILQGIPAPMVPEEFRVVADDVKSKLAPIPEEYVKAQLLQIKQKSGGKIESINVTKVLGAASVGEALLCRVKTRDNPSGDDVVVKILRPDSKARLLREEKIFKTAAKAAGEGMAITYDGQLARIKEEFDFLLEADNIVKGKVYDMPEYSKKENDQYKKVHSMKAHSLCPPTTDVLMLEKAPGSTVDGLLKDMKAARESKIKEATVESLDQNVKVFKTVKGYAETRKMLQNQYDDLWKHQLRVEELTEVWVEEAIFRSGFFHGDLHAGNMMVDKQHGVTVIDYGNVTQLSKQERAAMMRMSVYAGLQDADKFLEMFSSTLTPAGKAQLADSKTKAKVLEDIKEVFAKGISSDAPGHMFGALAVIQRANIETPPSVYNFMQSMLRLAGTSESMAAELGKIKDALMSLQPPEFGVPGSSLDHFGDLRAALAKGKSVAEVGDICQAASRFYDLGNKQYTEAFDAVVAKGGNAIDKEVIPVLRQYQESITDPKLSPSVTALLNDYDKLTTSEERKNFIQAHGDVKNLFATAMKSLASEVRSAFELGQEFKEPYEFIDAVANRLSVVRLLAHLPFADSVSLGLSMKSMKAKSDKEKALDALDTKGPRSKYAEKNGGPSVDVQQELDAQLDDGFRWLRFPRKFFTQLAAPGWTSNPEAVKAFKEVFAVNFADLINDLKGNEKLHPDAQELRKSIGYVVTHHLQRFPELAKAVKDLSPDSFAVLKKALVEKNPAIKNDVAYGQTAVDFLDALLGGEMGEVR